MANGETQTHQEDRSSYDGFTNFQIVVFVLVACAVVVVVVVIVTVVVVCHLLPLRRVVVVFVSTVVAIEVVRVLVVLVTSFIIFVVSTFSFPLNSTSFNKAKCNKIHRRYERYKQLQSVLVLSTGCVIVGIVVISVVIYICVVVAAVDIDIVGVATVAVVVVTVDVMVNVVHGVASGYCSLIYVTSNIQQSE